MSIKKSILVVIGLALSLFVTTCANTPTVPIPPPEVASIEEGTEAGMYIVNGDPGATDTGDVVLVYNSDLGYGVMEKADEDGSFSIEIEAEIGDEIIVQIKRGDLTLSSEEGHIIGSTW